MIPNNEHNKILNTFLKEHDDALNLRNEMNKYYTEIRIDNIKQKRDFYKFIAILSGVILGLISIIDKPIIKEYFFIGLILSILLIIFILNYIRETLDKEAAELRAEQDRYGGIMQEKINLVENYLNVKEYTEEIIKDYQEKLKSLPGVKLLSEEVNKLDEQRKKRHQEPLDYSGEIIIFIFVLSSFFIAASFLFPNKLEWTNLLFLIIIIFYISFTDMAFKFTKYISKGVSYLKKHEKSNQKNN